MKKNILIISIFLLCASIIAGLCLGAEFISPFLVFKDLVSGEVSLSLEIIREIRLPRVMAAAFAGAALSVSGTVFQSLFRNPLADPFITGVSGGASLGISIAVIFSLGPILTIISSFGGSIIAIIILYIMSFGKGFGGGIFILAGVAMSFIFSSSVMLLFSVAESQSVHKALIWMMGDLSSALGIVNYWIIFFLIFILILIIRIYHRHINIISLGRSFSHSSGINDIELRIILILASVLAALTVILGGIIPFVGLMIPHIVRYFTGHDNEILIPMSAITGAAFLILSDTLSRSIIFPYEIPIGIITGLAGGIFFLFFVFKRREVY
jgi:iron complex transport system permease protein